MQHHLLNTVHGSTRRTIFSLSSITLTGLALCAGLWGTGVQAANCSWQGGNGNWTDPNWNNCPGGFPASGDSASVNTGSITLDLSATVQQLLQSGGSITGSNDLTVTGLTHFNGSAVQGGTGITMASGGLLIDGTFLDIRASRTLLNSAGQTADWNAGNIRLLNSTSTLRNDGTFNINGNGRLLQGTGLFDNRGTLVTRLSSSLEETRITSRLDSSGSIEVQNGVLRLGGSGNYSGSLTSSATGTLAFSGGTKTLGAGSSVTATSVRFSSQDSAGGNTTIEGSYNVGNTVITGNTATFNATAQTATLNQSGGTLAGAGTLTVSGLTHFTGSAIQGGTGTTAASGGLLIDGTFLDIRASRTLLNSTGQTADWNAGNIRLLNNTSTLRNDGTFNINGNGRLLQGSGLLNNQGTMNVNLAGSTQTQTISSRVQQDGTVTVSNGTLNLSGTTTGGGQWQANGGVLRVDFNTDVSTTGNISVSNGGGLELDNRARLTGSNLSMDPTATLSAGSNSSLALSGDLSFAMTDETRWTLDATASLEMNGGSGAAIGDWGLWSSLEVGGLDTGTNPASHIGDPAGFIGNFSLSELVIGPSSRIFLADLFDNGNRNGSLGAAEALYVDTLIFADANALLNLNGLNLYYNTLIGSNGQIIDQTVVPVPAAVWLFGSGLLGLAGLAGRRRG